MRTKSDSWERVGHDIGRIITWCYYGFGLFWGWVVFVLLQADEVMSLAWWLLGIGLIIWGVPLGLLLLRVLHGVLTGVLWMSTGMTLVFDWLTRVLGRRVG